MVAYDDWVNERAAERASLTGRRSVAWAGVEVAFRGSEHGVAAQFTDVSLPFLQLLSLHMTFDDDSSAVFGIYQNDDV